MLKTIASLSVAESLLSSSLPEIVTPGYIVIELPVSPALMLGSSKSILIALGSSHLTSFKPASTSVISCPSLTVITPEVPLLSTSESIVSSEPTSWRVNSYPLGLTTLT